MSGLRWKLNRLRTMGVAEIGYRVEQVAHARLEKLGVGRARPQAAEGASGRPIAETMGAGIDPAPYRAAADRILSGRFKVFALDADLGFPPEWNTDPKTGTHAPMGFGKTLNYRDERVVGDIKYLWEPNRHLELVTLAQAYRLTGDLLYAEGCRTLVESWVAACPYPLGPNWTSSLEHSIRLVNWSFAWGLLGGDASPLFEGQSGRAFRETWLGSVRQHLHFIAGHFSKHSSANNHLLGEYLGLFVGSLTWPLWSESARWRAVAAKGFEEQALIQNAPDGVNREQAVYYQHEVMDMMLIAGLAARANGMDFAPPYWKRLERLCDFIAVFMDRGGNVPMIGDSDDALIVRLDPSPDFEPYRPLLAAGAILFGRGDLAAKAGRIDDKTRWLFPNIELPKATVRETRTAFPEGGYYLLGARFGSEDEVKAVIDCGPLGYLGIAAHGHADALSFTLSAFGAEWLIDPGTYAYHTQKAWRDYFRGTSAHNTIRVDGADQSEIGGAFMWLRKADAKLVAHDFDGGLFEGEHDGYRRLADPVTHRRRIHYNAHDNEFRVRDRIVCRSSHDIEIYWQFSEMCDVRLGEGGIEARVDGRRLTLACDAPGFTPALLIGSEAPIGGWVSRAFDVKVPATTGRWAGRIEGTAEIETILRLE